LVSLHDALPAAIRAWPVLAILSRHGHLVPRPPAARGPWPLRRRGSSHHRRPGQQRQIPPAPSVVAASARRAGRRVIGFISLQRPLARHARSAWGLPALAEVMVGEERRTNALIVRAATDPREGVFPPAMRPTRQPNWRSPLRPNSHRLCA